LGLKKKYGNWALITGASSGIGEAFSKYLAGLGMDLVLVARNEKKLTNLGKELKNKYNIQYLSVAIDLTKEGFIEKLAESVGSREVGILINNAGYGSSGNFTEIDTTHEIDMVKLNCLAPTILTHHFSKQMVERKKGAIIFLGSVAGLTPIPMMATYSATKAFNEFMGSSLWYELKHHNIDVLSLNPGGTKTGFQRIANTTTGPFVKLPEDVVHTAFNTLGKKPSVVDGWPNKVTAVLSKLFPKKLVVTISGKVAKKLYMHSDE